MHKFNKQTFLWLSQTELARACLLSNYITSLVFDSGHCGDVQDKRGNLAVAVARVLRQAKEPVPEFQELPSDSSSMPANLEWAPATAVIKAQRFAGCPACVSFGDPAEARSEAHFVDDVARQQALHSAEQALPSAKQDAPQNVCLQQEACGLQQEACADHVSESLLFAKSPLANRDALDDGHLSSEQTPLQSPTKASLSQQYSKSQQCISQQCISQHHSSISQQCSKPEAGQEVKRPAWMIPRRPSWLRPRLQPSHQVS
jgi:hypothetical protein